MRDHVLLYLNGARCCLRGLEAFLSLSEFLRASHGCTGVKIACGEGACGACTVLVGTPDRGTITYRTANACLHHVFQMDGRHVVTVEGLSSEGTLSAVQEAMVACHGSQCGFCTPGVVVSLTALIDRTDASPNDSTIRDALSGNLCRCTGYVPIFQAAQAVDQGNYRSLDALYPSDTIADDLINGAGYSLTITSDRTHLLQPATWTEAVQLRTEYPDATVLAGGTGFAGNFATAYPTLLSLSGVRDAPPITRENGAWFLPALATWEQVGAAAETSFPELAGLVARFGSPQLRNSGTVGGSVAHAESNADILPLLLVQEAQVRLASLSSTHDVAVAEFLSHRCGQDELVEGVLLREPTTGETLRLYKVRRRQAFDRSVFCAAVALGRGEDGRVTSARAAAGGVGPIPTRLRQAESFLQGAPYTENTMRQAGEIAANEVTPADDAYAGADYRRQLVAHLFLRFFHEESAR